MRIAIFVIAICLLTIFFHRKIKSYADAFRVSLVVSIVATVVYQLFGFFVIGYIDPFIIIAATVQIIVAIVTSFLTGFIILKTKVFWGSKGGAS